MIYQYLHGRDQVSGKAYGSINELDGKMFSKSDEDSLQRTIFYKPVPGINNNVPPECYYYYSGELTNGYVSIAGKTTYLLPGDSPLSGDRTSLFSHLYIFAGESQKEVVGNASKLFSISPYCCRLEDVKRQEQGKLIQYYDDRNQQVFGKEEIVDESLQELLSAFGIEEEDYDTLIYSILDACGSQEKRICLVLPENSKKGTDLALKLMQCIFENLPVWLKESCGYMTYCSSLQNLFPANMQIIFIPETVENVRSYMTQEVRYYIFDKKNQRMPHIPELNDRDIKKIVESFKILLFDNEQTKYYENMISLIMTYGECHRAFTPLQIKRLKQFWCAIKMISEDRILYKGSEWKTILDDILSMVPKLCIKIREDMENYAKTYMQCFSKKGEEDWVLKMFYAILPDIKEEIISYFCGQICDYDSFIFVMHFTEDMKELNGQIKKSIYNDRKYFKATEAYENEKLRQKLESLEDAESQFACVIKCMEEISQLQCMFLTSEEYYNMLRSNLKQIITWDSCNILEVSQFYQEFQDALNKYELEEKDVFSHMFFEVLKNFVSEIGNIQKLTDKQLQELSLWNNTIFDNPQYLEFADIKNSVAEEVKLREQAAIFKNDDLEEMYGDIKKLIESNPKDIEKLFRNKEILKDTNRIRVRLQELPYKKYKKNKRSSMEEVFDGLYEICFRYDVTHREEICSQIMNSKWGGFLSLSKIYRNVCGMTKEEKKEISFMMKRTIESFYNFHPLNAEERNALKEEIGVAEKIEVAHLLKEEEQNLFKKFLGHFSSKEEVTFYKNNKGKKQEKQKKSKKEITKKEITKKEIRSTEEEPFGK